MSYPFIAGLILLISLVMSLPVEIVDTSVSLPMAFDSGAVLAALGKRIIPAESSWQTCLRPVSMMVNYTICNNPSALAPQPNITFYNQGDSVPVVGGTCFRPFGSANPGNINFPDCVLADYGGTSPNGVVLFIIWEQHQCRKGTIETQTTYLGSLSGGEQEATFTEGSSLSKDVDGRRIQLVVTPVGDKTFQTQVEMVDGDSINDGTLFRTFDPVAASAIVARMVGFTCAFSGKGTVSDSYANNGNTKCPSVPSILNPYTQGVLQRKMGDYSTWSACWSGFVPQGEIFNVVARNGGYVRVWDRNQPYKCDGVSSLWCGSDRTDNIISISGPSKVDVCATIHNGCLGLDASFSASGNLYQSLNGSSYTYWSPVQALVPTIKQYENSFYMPDDRQVRIHLSAAVPDTTQKGTIRSISASKTGIYYDVHGGDVHCTCVPNCIPEFVMVSEGKFAPMEMDRCAGRSLVTLRCDTKEGNLSYEWRAEQKWQKEENQAVPSGTSGQSNGSPNNQYVPYVEPIVPSSTHSMWDNFWDPPFQSGWIVAIVEGVVLVAMIVVGALVLFIIFKISLKLCRKCCNKEARTRRAKARDAKKKEEEAKLMKSPGYELISKGDVDSAYQLGLPSADATAYAFNSAPTGAALDAAMRTFGVPLGTEPHKWWLKATKRTTATGSPVRGPRVETNDIDSLGNTGLYGGWGLTSSRGRPSG
jgi:hypothetical protein